MKILNDNLNISELKSLFNTSEKFNYVNDKVLSSIEHYYSLYDEDKLVGIITYKDYKNCKNSWKKDFTFDNTLCVSELIIHPKYQRKGYGSMLIDIVKHHAIRHDFKQLILSTDQNENDGVKNFYNKLGFELSGLYKYNGIDLTLEIYTLNVNKRIKVASYSLG